MLSVQTVHECVPRHFILYATARCCLSLNSHDHTHMPLLKAVQDAQTNIALLTVIQGACFFPSRNTHDSASGQCCDCLTSIRLSWDEDGVGLPRDMPLTVTLALWLCITKSRTRTSQIFCVSCSHHRTCG
jgi:hypothetical protein